MLNKLKSLKNHQGFMKYLKNTSWLFGEKILRMIVGLLVGIWVARYLGPEQFGLLSYAQSFVGLFTVIATLGLDGIVIRELVKDENKREVLLGTAFRLKLIGAFGVLIFLAIAINFTSNDYYTNILIFIIASATIFQSLNVIDFYFQSRVLSKYVVYANIISLFISTIIKIILLFTEAPLISFAWIILFDSFILAIGYLYFFIKTNLTFNIQYLSFNKKMAVSLLRDSWPLIFIGVIISLNMKIDQVMIKEILDTEAVGQYAAAVRLSEVWYFIPMVAASSLFPAIINAKKHSEVLYYERLQKLYDLMIWVTIVIAFPIAFLSDWIVEVLYGHQYNKAGSVLMIHIYSLLFICIQTIGGKWVIAEGFQKIALLRAAISTSINILLNYMLIPKYGIVAAAYTTLISYGFVSYVSNLFFKSHHKHFLIITKAIFLPIRKIINR